MGVKKREISCNITEGGGEEKRHDTKYRTLSKQANFIVRYVKVTVKKIEGTGQITMLHGCFSADSLYSDKCQNIKLLYVLSISFVIRNTNGTDDSRAVT